VIFTRALVFFRIIYNSYNGKEVFIMLYKIISVALAVSLAIFDIELLVDGIKMYFNSNTNDEEES
jgi:hypothetical protein